jgi:hypothetical protein
MKTKFLQTLVLVLTALVAVSAFVCADGSREYEVDYFQAEMLKESPESLTARPAPQALYHLPVADSGRSHHSRGSGAVTKSTALVCLSTCVLLC